MKSENFDQIVRLATLLNCNYELSIEVAELDDRISSNTKDLKFNRQLDNLNRRSHLLDHRVDMVQENLNTLRQTIHAKRKNLTTRRRHLNGLIENESSTSIQRNTPSEPINQSQTKVIRSHLLNHLNTLFPIINIDNTFTFSILGLTIDSTNAILSSSALGYTSLLTLVLSSYLNIHLPYQIVYKGSYSYIIDNISNIRGNNAFPLHSHLKKDHLYRLEYALYLLNKNIQVVSSTIYLNTLFSRSHSSLC